MKFYIGMEDGSGVVANTKEEFLQYLEDYIIDAEKRQQEYFEIEIAG